MSSLQDITIKKAIITPCKGSEEVSGADGIGIERAIVKVDYFEDILSPNITCYIKINSSSNVYGETPLRGFERLDLNIGTANGDMIFDETEERPPLYVSAVRDLLQSEGNESMTLVCKTKECFDNEVTRCGKRYGKVTISTHVRDILTNTLKVKNDRIKEIEESATAYGFMGNMKKPFHTLVWLSPKAQVAKQGTSGTSGKGKDAKAKGTSGYFFYENYDGFHFRSIESMLSGKTSVKSADDKVIPQYTATGVTDRTSTDRQIIHHFVDKNTDLQKNLRIGLYNNLQYFFDPIDWQLDAIRFQLKDERAKLEKAGGQSSYIPLPGEGDEAPLTNYSSRIMSRIGDTGMLSGEINEDPQSSGRDPADMCKAFSRYNLLLTQSLNIVIACNTTLRAGDLIHITLPSSKPTEGNLKEADQHQSGNYLIRSLRHHFEIAGGTNTTSLNLVRDSYGNEN
jgi:hypothetical protein